MNRTKIHIVVACDHIDERPAVEHHGVLHQPGGFLRQDVPAGLADPHHPTHATSTPSTSDASSTRQGGGRAAIVGAEHAGWSR